VFAEGSGRGWQLICPRCGKKKIVTANKGQALPPEMVAKKFQQANWQVGRKPEDDLCPDCNLAVAVERRTKADTNRMRGQHAVTASNGAGTQQSLPEAATRSLSNEQAVLTLLAMIEQMETLLPCFDDFDDEGRRVLSRSLAEFERFVHEILPVREYQPPKSELQIWLENLGNTNDQSNVRS
jgi:hypothetical protein